MADDPSAAFRSVLAGSSSRNHQPTRRILAPSHDPRPPRVDARQLTP